jgi:hypothetical protein
MSMGQTYAFNNSHLPGLAFTDTNVLRTGCEK